MKKRNRKLRKVLLVACSALILVCISVGATIAYLTDSEAVTNTFKVGQVGLKLDEAVTDENGEPQGNERTTGADGNDYKLIPGQSYTKDPTITVDAKSEDCFVIAKIEVTGATELNGLLGYKEADGKEYIGFGGFVSGGVFNDATIKYDAEKARWEGKDVYLTQSYDDGVFTFHIYYKNPQAANAKLVLFDNLTVPGEWSNSDIAGLDDMEMKVSAYAVQAAGMSDVFAAYEAGITANWKA